jgi:hypothetical protein
MTVSGQLAALGPSGSTLAAISASCVRNTQEARSGGRRRTTDGRSLEKGPTTTPWGCELLGSGDFVGRSRRWPSDRKVGR